MMTLNKSFCKIQSTKRLYLLIAILFGVFAQPTYGQHQLAETVISTIQPDSMHIEGRSYQLYDSKVQARNFAIGGNLFLGYGVFNGNISNSFTNPFYVGIQVDFYYKRFIFQLDDYIGFCKVKKTLPFPDSLEWAQNESAFSVLFGGNIGYAFIDKEALTITFLTGMGANFMTSLFKETDNSKNEPTLPYYKVGCYFDFKNVVISGDHIRINNSDVYYASLRLSLGFNYPISNPDYPQYYDGSIFYVTIGMGGFQRNCKMD